MAGKKPTIMKDTALIGQHKKLAMGMPVTGKKKGGTVGKGKGKC